MADIVAATWSETDASNNSASPLGWTPGVMLPSQVEPTAQAMMGATKRWFDNINGTVTTSGSSGSYVYATVNTTYPTAYISGLRWCFYADKISAGNDTFAINALGAKKIYKPTSAGILRVAAGDIQASTYVELVYNSTLDSAAGGWLMLSFPYANIVSSAINYMSGLGISNNAGTPNTKVDVATGVAIDSTNVVLMTLGSTGTVDFGASGANGLDTGSLASSKWYAILLIYGSSGTAVMATLEAAGSSISPTMPSGYTKYRYIGSVYSNGSTHIAAFKQFGQRFFWSSAVQDYTATPVFNTPTVVTTLTPLGIVTFPWVQIVVNDTGAASATSFINVGNTSTVPYTRAPVIAQAQAGTIPNYVHFESIPTNTSAQMEIVSGNSTTQVAWNTLGWIDPHIAAQW